jgi:hypothetical protein
MCKAMPCWANCRKADDRVVGKALGARGLVGPSAHEKHKQTTWSLIRTPRWWSVVGS